MVIDFDQLRERESTKDENHGMELLDCTIVRLGHFHIHRNRRLHQLDVGRRLELPGLPP